MKSYTLIRGDLGQTTEVIGDFETAQTARTAVGLQPPGTYSIIRKIETGIKVEPSTSHTVSKGTLYTKPRGPNKPKAK